MEKASAKEKKFLLDSQSQKLVRRLCLYFRKEYENQGPLKGYTKVNERVADALQISLSSVKRISKEGRIGKTFKTPGKKRNCQKPKTNIDSFDMSAIRYLIYEFYERKEWPTRLKLLESLKQANLFKGGKSSLSTILKKLNFKWRHLEKRRYLVERKDIFTARSSFLRKFKDCDLEKAIFLGETWINADNSISKSWTNFEQKMSFGKGGRLILLNAGNAHGFIPNCCLLFRCHNPNDYHREMNFNVFRDWFQVLVENIPENSVIIMDNVKYYSIEKDESPSSNWKKKDIQEWLTKENIRWEEEMLRGELLGLAAMHKPKEKKYELSELAAKKGHTIICLPPYHFEFNPIEVIWAKLKETIAEENKTFFLNDVEIITKKKIDLISKKDWKNSIKHVKEIIENAWKQQQIIEKNLDEMIITKVEESYSSLSEYDESSEEEEVSVSESEFESDE